MLDLLGSLRRAPRRFVASRVAFHLVFALLLFVPHFFGSRESPKPYHFGIPRIHSGDEPHYLVHVHSIIDDGDLSLGNNYDKVHKGSLDAGLLFRGSDLNHHSIWFVGDRRVHWAEVFKREGPWAKDAEGHPVPVVREGIDPALLPKVEAPWNSPGLPLLLSPIFWVVSRAGFGLWIEPVATVLSAIAILIASFFWRILASEFTKNRALLNVGMAFAFLGTPAWHYGRSFFSEPYLICLVTGAYAFAIVRKRFYLAGFLIGMSIFMKPVAALMAVPIGVLLLARGDVRNAVRFSLPVAFWIVVQLVENSLLFGSPIHTSNEFKPGAPLYNAFAILANPTRGILSTAPIVVFAAAGWGTLVRQSRAAIAPLLACLGFFVVVACNHAWSGGYAYSCRFLVPLMPIFCLGVIPLLKGPLRNFVFFVAAISICINGLAAVQYWRAFNNHPVLYLVPSTEWDPAPTA